MGGRIWSPEEDQRIRELFANLRSAKVAKMLGRSKTAVDGRAHKLGVFKSPEYIAAQCRLQKGTHIGKNYQYKPGSVPFNKGLRRPGSSTGRMPETQFQKGSRPGNTMPVGTIRPNSDGYLRIKVSDAPEPAGGKGGSTKNWEFVHKRVWEAAHGPIPAGHRLWWKNGDRNDCSLENLELLSPVEHMAKTTIHNSPPEIKETVFLIGRVKRAIKRRVKKDAAEK